MVKNMTRKKYSLICIGIFALLLTAYVWATKVVDANTDKKTDSNEKVDKGEMDTKADHEEMDIPENLYGGDIKEEEMPGKEKKKVYKDKFVDLHVDYLGSGISTNPAANWPMQKSICDDGEECALTGYTIFWSNKGYETYAIPLEIHDLNFELNINPDNYYLMIYGRELSWMQYNPGRVSQFGGVYYRIGVDWESDIEEGTFFFYEIDGEQIERGYLPEEITLEF